MKAEFNTQTGEGIYRLQFETDSKGAFEYVQEAARRCVGDAHISRQGETVRSDKMDLMDTAPMMGSNDYKERFKAEYYQTKIRYEKLHKMCVKYEAGTLDFEPTCSLELLKEQKAAMGNYLRCLEVRAEIEGINL